MLRQNVLIERTSNTQKVKKQRKNRTKVCNPSLTRES